MILTKENLLTDSLIEASNESALYPITNALNVWNNIPFKANLLSVIIDLKTNVAATLLNISKHNFTSAITIEYYSDSTYTTKITEESIPLEDTIIFKMSNTAAYRRLIISGTEKPEIGYIKLCNYIEVDVIADTSKIGLELSDYKSESSLGNNNVQERFNRDDISLTFWIVESILKEFFEIFKNHRLTYPLFIWQFPDGDTYLNKRCVLFDQKRLAPTRRILGKDAIYYRFTVKFKEAK